MNFKSLFKKIYVSSALAFAFISSAQSATTSLNVSAYCGFQFPIYQGVTGTVGNIGCETVEDPPGSNPEGKTLFGVQSGFAEDVEQGGWVYGTALVNSSTSFGAQEIQLDYRVTSNYTLGANATLFADSGFTDVLSIEAPEEKSGSLTTIQVSRMGSFSYGAGLQGVEKNYFFNYVENRFEYWAGLNINDNIIFYSSYSEVSNPTGDSVFGSFPESLYFTEFAFVDVVIGEPLVMQSSIHARFDGKSYDIDTNDAFTSAKGGVNVSYKYYLTPIDPEVTIRALSGTSYAITPLPELNVSLMYFLGLSAISIYVRTKRSPVVRKQPRRT